ncbi:MAG: hypothetical protein IRY85_07255 [Micromonosporaceae bacterium]|nr:hypothetical protein [Micromonosporaceae bacterium]
MAETGYRDAALVLPVLLASDLSLDEYLRLQAVVYRVARAVEQVVPSERTYVLSLGSQQGNPHVHWHIAPLPPGLPYERQQFHALMAGHRGARVVAGGCRAVGGAASRSIGGRRRSMTPRPQVPRR